MDVQYHISHQWLLNSLSTHFMPLFTQLIALHPLQETRVSFQSLLPASPLLTNSPQLCHSEPRNKEKLNQVPISAAYKFCELFSL